MKRIIQCVTNDLSTDQRMHRICQTLVDDGYEVILVGRKLRDSLSLSASKYQTKRLNCFFVKGVAFYVEFNLRLFFFLLITNFDVVCANDADTLLACGIAKAIKRKKGTYDSHEYFTETPELEGKIIKKKIWSLVEFIFIKKMNAYYTVGEALAEELSKKYGVRFEVVRNIPTSRGIANNTDHQEKILLYQGVLNKGRGLESIILAMKYLPNYQLWLAGKGDVEQSLKKLTLHENIKNVHFLGKIEPAELFHTSQMARYGLNLLDGSSKNYYYSLANKFFDYLRAGIPSINMNFPEYNTILSKHAIGFTLLKLDPIELAELIKSIDDSPDLYKTTLQAISKVQFEYTWEKEGEKLLSIYNKL